MADILTCQTQMYLIKIRMAAFHYGVPVPGHTHLNGLLAYLDYLMLLVARFPAMTSQNVAMWEKPIVV